MKSPRWKGKAVEVGPLARVLMMYASGHEQTKELVGMALKKLDLPVQALYSTLGRTAARTLETKTRRRSKCRAGTTNWSPTSRQATSKPSTIHCGNLQPGPAMRKV